MPMAAPTTSSTAPIGTSPIPSADTSKEKNASAAAAITVNGDVSIGSGSTFNGSSFTHQVKGNWSVGGTFTPSTGTVAPNVAVKKVDNQQLIDLASLLGQVQQRLKENAEVLSQTQHNLGERLDNAARVVGSVERSLGRVRGHPIFLATPRADLITGTLFAFAS